MKAVVLTDLDGTLLDGHTYDWRPAKPALDALARAGVPLVICTSKTRAEVEALRREIGHRHPFCVENGAAVYVPAGYFGDEAMGQRRGGYDVVEIGAPYVSLVAALGAAARAARVDVRGWHAMDLAEVVERCELDPDRARLAMQREYDEPFVVVDGTPEGVARLGAEIAARGHRMTRGDRFFHITGTHDKGSAVRPLLERYRRAAGSLRVIAAGDAPNDAAMLALADDAIVIDSPMAAALHERVPRAIRTRLPGPAGWNEGILGLIPS